MHSHRLPVLWLLAILAPARAADVAELDWLSGCWAYEGFEAGSGENWTAAAGGTMFGTSRIVRDGRTVQWEFLRIVANDDGGIDYVASPSGQATATFAMRSLAELRVVFENPAHDFPQRIAYELLSADRLLARIEGDSDAGTRRIEFPMTRTACANTLETPS